MFHTTIPNIISTYIAWQMPHTFYCYRFLCQMYPFTLLFLFVHFLIKQYILEECRALWGEPSWAVCLHVIRRVVCTFDRRETWCLGDVVLFTSSNRSSCLLLLLLSTKQNKATWHNTEDDIMLNMDIDIR